MEQLDTGQEQSPFSARAAWITLAVLLAAAAYLCYLILHPLVAPILGAGILAVVFFPLHQRVQRGVTRPSLAALLSTLVILIVFLAPVALIVATIARELSQAYQAWSPGSVEQQADKIWKMLETPLRAVATVLGMSVDELRGGLSAKVQEGITALLGRGVRLLGSATGGVVKGILSLATLYLAFLHGGKLYRSVLEWSPLGRRRTEALCGAAHTMILASFYGVIAVAFMQGLLCGLGVWIAGLPSPALWGLAASLASLLPLVGSGLVWLPAAAVLFAQGSIGSGVFMLAWGAGIVAMADNVVRPLVVMAKSPMHPLVTFIAILGGIQAFGLIGILAGPLVLVITAALFGILREELRGPSAGS